MMAVERSKTTNGAMKHVVVVLGMIMIILSMIGMAQLGVKAEGEKEAVSSDKNVAMIEMKVLNLYPESFDWDAKHNRFLVGSMSQGRLVSVTEEGIVEDFVQDEEYAGASILGVTVDSTHNRVLVVVYNRGGDRPMSALAAYDLDSKTRTLYVNLVGEDDLLGINAVANDVAVDGDGSAYITNSAGNSIWKVTLQGVKNVLIDSVPQLPFAVEQEYVQSISTNGIVHHDGYLLVGQTNSGAIFRVRLADKDVQAVKIEGGVVMPGADGMAVRSDGSLVVLSMHTAWLLSSNDSWQSATLVDKVALDAAGATTSGAVNDLRVFTIHSHFPNFFNGMDWHSFEIVDIKFSAADDLNDTDDLNDNNPLWLLAALGIFAVVVFSWKFQMNRFNKEYTKKRV